MIALNGSAMVSLRVEDGRSGSVSSPAQPSHHRAAAPLRQAIFRTRQYLLSGQHQEGYWLGELEGDSILESETILLLAYFDRHDSTLARQAAEALLRSQREEGGWSLYPGGPVDVSASVKAYFALKLAGHEPQSEPLERARRAVLECGGAEKVNSFTRFYLALLGQIPFEKCPEVPPEMMLLPRWFPVNLWSVSAWSRTMFVPLSVISALRPVRSVDPRLGIQELFVQDPRDWPWPEKPGGTQSVREKVWSLFFRGVNRVAAGCRRWGLVPFRPWAVRRARQWILDRSENSDGLGAIFPPIVWSAIALEALGDPRDRDAVEECFRQLEGLVLKDEDRTKIQPCKSPVWDTAIALLSLIESGPQCSEPTVRHGVDWLVARQCLCPGDWSQTVRAEAGGWAFEFNNPFYPDLDDTAMVLLTLKAELDGGGPSTAALPPELKLLDRSHGPADGGDADRRRGALRSAAQRGLQWMLAMQNRDGGWGAFDRNNDCQALCYVPFADHNAMIDPSSADVTARVLEALGAWGFRSGDRHIDRAVEYLRRTQQADGSWQGRWGVNHIYGTWQVLTGLVAVGLPAGDAVVAAGARWILAHQQPSGGWGESPESYADPAWRGRGQETASQTAWAILGLLAAGYERHPAVARGVRYLLDTQQSDGTWSEPQFTGTGFPLVFYLRYHLYPIYFPLLAMARWARAMGSLFEDAEAVCRRMSEAVGCEA